MAAACNLTFCVVGRDARQLAAARALQNSGYTVLGAEGAGQADYILLPMPMDAEAADLARILRAARPGTLALGGRISEPVRKAAQAAGVELVDYFLRPELACLNAVPTAEGCLALLMQLRQRTIWESEFLVLGYGRIGRAVARRLQALGGQVTIAARAPEQRAAARCAGLHAAPLTALEQLLPHSSCFTGLSTGTALNIMRHSPLFEINQELSHSAGTGRLRQQLCRTSSSAGTCCRQHGQRSCPGPRSDPSRRLRP